MQINGFLAQLRQYRQLSERKHKSYAPVVDQLVTSFKESEAKFGTTGSFQPDLIDEIAAREYPDYLRSFPLSRPTE